MSPSSACIQLHSRSTNCGVDLVLRQQRRLDHRHRRRFGARAHVDPDQAAALVDLVGLCLDLVLEALRRRDVRHLEAVAFHVELPAVIDAADAARLVAAEEQRRAAMRAAMVHHADAAAGSRRGTRSASRRAASARTGSPPAFSSLDLAAGIQYWRIRLAHHRAGADPCQFIALDC